MFYGLVEWRFHTRGLDIFFLFLLSFSEKEICEQPWWPPGAAERVWKCAHNGGIKSRQMNSPAFTFMRLNANQVQHHWAVWLSESAGCKVNLEVEQGKGRQDRGGLGRHEAREVWPAAGQVSSAELYPADAFGGGMGGIQDQVLYRAETLGPIRPRTWAVQTFLFDSSLIWPSALGMFNTILFVIVNLHC